MDDILDNKARIEQKIIALEEERNLLLGLSMERAIAISNYDRAIALTMLKLMNEQLLNFENQEIKKVSVTTAKDFAKGICWREKLKVEESDGKYRACVSNIDCIKAELNGLQSINRHLQ